MIVKIVGDLHGRDTWKHLIYSEYDEAYVLGDYFDSFDLPFEEQYKNIKELFELASKDNRIKLVFGNHDFHYIYINQMYSGYQLNNSNAINKLLTEYLSLFRIAYDCNNYLISHAGVSQEWVNQFGITSIDDINDAFLNRIKIFEFADNATNRYGDNKNQGPLWIRPFSLSENVWRAYPKQIVGHTSSNRMQYISNDEVEIYTFDVKNVIHTIHIDENGITAIIEENTIK